MSVALKKTLELSQKQTVLFFDDDKVSQELVKASLDSDFNVICESSGANAIESVKSAKPNLILLDLNMPNVDGFEVLKRLKGHPVLSAIPIICLSGKKDEASRTRAYSLGASGFMTKPIDVTQMSSDVKALVKSMKVELTSIDGKKQIYIGLNSSEKLLKLKSDLKICIDSGKKAIVISLQDGKNFFNVEEFKEELATGRVLYFQIKPSLLTRLPYLEDLSPITQDIKDLISEETFSYELFFEDPDVILDIRSEDRLVATAMKLSQSFNKSFLTVKYYSKSYQEQVLTNNLNSLAKVLVGSY